MVDLSSPASLIKQRQALNDLDLVLFGIMLWECVMTGWFDLEILMRKRPFKFPVGLYWLTKYGSLCFIISANVTDFGVRINCQAVGSFTDVVSGIGMAGSSGILMLRAMALWGLDRRIVIPLLLAHLGQWAVNLHDAFIVREHWGITANGTEGCVFESLGWSWLKIQFVYTMLFDFTVLLLATIALLRVPGRSNLWKLLWIDGLCYFFVAFVCYLAITIIVFLSISVELRWMFSDLANIFVAIAACRSFLRLSTRVDRQVALPSEPLPDSAYAPIQFAPPKEWLKSPVSSSLMTATTATDVEHVVSRPTLPIPEAVATRDIDLESGPGVLIRRPSGAAAVKDRTQVQL